MSEFEFSEISDVEPIMELSNEVDHELTPDQLEQQQALDIHKQQIAKMNESDFIDFSDEEATPMKQSSEEWQDELMIYMKKEDLNPIEVYYCQCLCVLIKLISEGVGIEYHPIVDLMVKIKSYMSKYNKRYAKDDSEVDELENTKEMAKIENDAQNDPQNDSEGELTDEMDDDPFNDATSKYSDAQSDQESLEMSDPDEPINFDELVETDSDSNTSEIRPSHGNYKRLINNIIPKSTKTAPLEHEMVFEKPQPILNSQVNESQLNQLNEQADAFSDASEDELTFEQQLANLKPGAHFNREIPKTRNINYSIQKNKQFTTGKRSLNSNPRVRKKAKFDKATKKNQSSHATYKGHLFYQGELSGINDRVIKSTKFE
eukprot:NODE_152_length_15391_cov_0.883272.p3 type:complete len:374 gc:universal NODE_152_length_15391_cov_0.883272:13130-12009(-)